MAKWTDVGMADKHILVFGEVTRDIIASTSDLAPIESVGLLSDITHAFGGRGANVALFASISGLQSKLLSFVGKDFESAGCKTHLEKHGVDCNSMLVVEGQTAQAFIFRNLGRATTYFYPGCALVDKATLSQLRQLIGQFNAEIVYCTSGIHEGNLQILADSSHALRVYAPGPEIFHCSAEQLRSLLEVSDCVFLNEAESEEFLEKMKLNHIELNTAFDLSFHVVTRGEQGSTIYEGNQEMLVRPCRPDRIADETGAGDSYAGAFLAEFLRTGDLLRSGQFASVVSSFVVEKVGCQTNIPTRENIKERDAEYLRGER